MQKKSAALPRAKSTPKAAPAEAKSLHPRSKHNGRYDFKKLVECCPELAAFVSLNAYKDESIDFANPDAVRALNRAILQLHYGITGWDIPALYLCPPIPGRANYLHYLADLLAASNGGVIPCGEDIQVLDIGIGASAIFPLLGHSEYGWSFVGTDIDRAALACAEKTIYANKGYGEAIELRHQTTRSAIFKNVTRDDELFDLTLCNPPFHASMDEARTGSERKWQNLGKQKSSHEIPVLNFGGQAAELCCVGGEEGFIGRIIAESAQIRNQCLWFTTLVSKASSLPSVYRALKLAEIQSSKTIEMSQGQKKSRLVAWTFLTERQQQAWRNRRRGG